MKTAANPQNLATRKLLGAVARPSEFRRSIFTDAKRAIVNFSCDAVDNARDQFDYIDDKTLLLLLIIGIKHKISGGDRDVV